MAGCAWEREEGAERRAEEEMWSEVWVDAGGGRRRRRASCGYGSVYERQGLFVRADVVFRNERQADGLGAGLMGSERERAIFMKKTIQTKVGNKSTCSE